MKVLRCRGYTILQLLFAIGATCGIALMIFPPYSRAKVHDQRSTCLSNLKQIGLGMAQYVQDYDGRFPHTGLASRTPYGWADSINPYLLTTEVFHCPSAWPSSTNLDDPTLPGYTDYYLNNNVAGVEQKYFTLSERTIMSGDGEAGSYSTNARYFVKTLPEDWRYNPGSPARRHLEMANYLFVDGHVRSASVVNIQEQWSETGYQYTFAIGPGG
jgi:prepilin-type processing-associated H-X9-DG protein